ncbi:expressed unknown protein [Seminavis robusta]|uniref:Uncharacterized protein n=1 Tax=Seminavis robusta TaxID=568900 RepID=A0A9N8E0J7_9STRA|nr:expressed unknown protein [Seminavis robusta]|eukprot:Sro528_g160850.1 n/a (149) ;mRNA; f:36619-37175
MGINTSSLSFQQCMACNLGDLHEASCFVDDIVVFRNSFQVHSRFLGDLGRLFHANLMLQIRAKEAEEGEGQVEETIITMATVDGLGHLAAGANTRAIQGASPSAAEAVVEGVGAIGGFSGRDWFLPSDERNNFDFDELPSLHQSTIAV